MKKMRLKKKRKIPNLILYSIILFLLYECLNYMFINVQLTNSNEEFIKKMLQNSNYHLLYEKSENNLVSKILSFFGNFKLKEPVTILEKALAFQTIPEEIPKYEYQTFSYIENSIIDKPRVYIYNTHPTEAYVGVGLDEYGVSAGVMMATYLLQDKLNEMGIATIVEERSASTYIKEHNLDYEDSYVATREFLKTTLEEYPDLELIIDLHRDGVPKDASTVTINNKDYARVLFVMNPNYNILFGKKISDKVNELYPGLSRGIYDKRKHNFNQDLNKNVILLELGGEANTVSEVVNTVDAMAKVIKEFLS